MKQYSLQPQHRCMTGTLKGGSFSAFKTDSFLLNARADGTEEQQQQGRPN